ncbi:N-formylglutamate amidohydrolase [Rufibacter psychrotolerans]|uniref:N-formylglutamate amidohydrolase n=1 Tax=Rufibacter psychrotolerans TaxID=2812556 RepID=UPI001966DBB2|nr:N-formylglutamate amidohydrolase [Rufibacter sp. SYSU D00308]
MNAPRLKVLLTCEHGGNQVPPEYAPLFAGAEAVLATHRGYDLGALELFHRFKDTADFSVYSTTSRLVVELNRSLHHPKLFSEFMQPLSAGEHQAVLEQYYYPFRQQVEDKIREWVGQEYPVLHLSVHSFTPELNGKVRTADVGLLYDPRREREQLFAALWRQRLELALPRFKIRYNYPYKGTADGFVTYLRRRFPNRQYAGLELEVNQKFSEGDPVHWRQVQEGLVHTFTQVL